MSNIEKSVENLVEPIINELGYELYDVIYEKQVKDYYLRIFIDNKNGINLDDCENVNNSITDKLDELECLKNQYFLEVSSPGIERNLRKEKHFKDNIGKDICIKLFKPLNNENRNKELIGKLKGYDKENIKIQIDNEDKNEYKIITVECNNISNIKTIYHWE